MGQAAGPAALSGEARWVVLIAYDPYYAEVRPPMGDNQIGRKTLVAVAVARAQFAISTPAATPGRPINPGAAGRL